MAETPQAVKARFAVKADLLTNGIFNGRKGKRQRIDQMCISVAGPVNGERCLGTQPYATQRRNEFTGNLEDVLIPCFTEEEIKATLEYDASLAKWFDYPQGFVPGQKGQK